MDLNLVGLNHKTAPIEIREKFVFSHDMLSHVLKDLKLKTGAEALILSTCNRTEIYFQVKDPNEIYQWLATFNKIKFTELKKYLYTFSNQDCYVHACKVASGLDSMLIGETQIFGQMKQASQIAHLSGVQGKYINTFFQDVFKTAKEVRTKTQIGSSATTIASCALAIAKKIFGEINQTQVMFVGAGDISEMCAKYFQKYQPKKISIANRSFEKGEALAKKVNGEACLIGEIYDQLHNYDVLISSTASQLPIIGLGVIEQALKKRKHRPIMLVDLAIPRDIESEVSKLDDVFLYTLDDLVNIAQQGLTNRQGATKKATQIIEHQAKDFYNKTRQIKNTPTIRLLRNQFEKIALAEAEKAKSIKIGSSSDEVINKLISNLTKKFLHGPTKAIRENEQDFETNSLIKKFITLKKKKMKASMKSKLEALVKRIDVLNTELSHEDVTKDMEKYKKISKEHSDITPIVEIYKKFQKITLDITDAKELLNDPEMKVFAQEEIEKGEASIEEVETELLKLLIPKDDDDEKNIFIEIRAGAGGDESALFVGDIYRMYTRYAERMGWKIEIISSNSSEAGGFKEVIMKVMGSGVYAKLKFESGGHRVQRVPDTETQGRIHTSACTVAVLAEADEISDVDINPADIRIDTYRASGAGGQHINKTDSAVRITHLPTGIVVECQDDRSQHRNKAQAMSVLAARIKDNQIKEQQNQIASERKSLIGSGDRSERIRTYNFPQGRITDHRINLTLYKVDYIMDGDLTELIEALTAEHQADLLAQIEKE